MYAQCAIGAAVHPIGHASEPAGKPSPPQWFISAPAALHESMFGAHWLHRFASALQPAAPQSCLVTPSPVSLQVSVVFPSHPTNSCAVHATTSAGFGKPQLAVNHSKPRMRVETDMVEFRSCNRCVACAARVRPSAQR